MNETVQEGAVAQPRPMVKRRRKSPMKGIIVALVLLAGASVGGYYLWNFLSTTEEVESTIQSGFAQYSSIQSSVQGSGGARAKDTAAISLTQSGVVQNVQVTAGDIVMEGQPLYTIFSQDAEDAVDAALEDVAEIQGRIDDVYEDIADLEETRADLVVTAPFAGKLTQVSTFTEGLTVPEGTEVATLVNDKQLKLSLYFSYAYEGEIQVGQGATLSIPAVMASFPATVEQVHQVHFISPQGSDYFEVVLVFDNPGTLTEGMVATATLTAGDGTPIYPYESQETAYYESQVLVTEVAGSMISADLLRYANVTQEQELLVLDSDDLDDDIREKEEEIATIREELVLANETLVKAQDALVNFNAVAPIDGTVTTCTLSEGAEVSAGDTVIIISNNTTMLVDITVDDRNIGFVTPGMMVELTDWNGNMFMGTVTSINTGDAQAGQGMTEFPVTLTVDNYGGQLLEGVWLDYSFVTSQSENCIVVPSQSVKQVSDVDGNIVTVVFIKAETPPEEMVEVELPPVEPGQTPTLPTVEDGYYPVAVSTGLSDNYNVEITHGLNGDEEIFLNFFVEQAYSW